MRPKKVPNSPPQPPRSAISAAAVGVSNRVLSKATKQLPTQALCRADVAGMDEIVRSATQHRLQRSSQRGHLRGHLRRYQERSILSRGCEGIASLSSSGSECVNRQWSGSSGRPGNPTTCDGSQYALLRSLEERLKRCRNCQLVKMPSATVAAATVPKGSSPRAFEARRRNREVARSRYGAKHRNCAEQRATGGSRR